MILARDFSDNPSIEGVSGPADLCVLGIDLLNGEKSSWGRPTAQALQLTHDLEFCSPEAFLGTVGRMKPPAIIPSISLNPFWLEAFVRDSTDCHSHVINVVCADSGGGG